MSSAPPRLAGEVRPIIREFSNEFTLDLTFVGCVRHQLNTVVSSRPRDRENRPLLDHALKTFRKALWTIRSTPTKYAAAWFNLGM